MKKERKKRIQCVWILFIQPAAGWSSTFDRIKHMKHCIHFIECARKSSSKIHNLPQVNGFCNQIQCDLEDCVTEHFFFFGNITDVL